MQKRRTAPRQRTLKGGTISFGHAVIDCVLRNVSATGACLEVASPIGIPDDFTLIIKSDNTSRRCHVAWRAAQRIGVRFE
jgi:PilZ domain-containing protein